MRVLKTDISVTDSWRDYEMGDIVHVGYQSFGFVSVWWLEPDYTLPTKRLCVFGTGWDIPTFEIKNSPVHRGTAIDVGAKLVWHLFEDVLP